MVLDEIVHAPGGILEALLHSTYTMLLSVIVITRNERVNIADCLLSADFADEIIVLDHASSDATADIARSMGAQVVVVQDWPGFGPQKNQALDLARGGWVLSIDADERVTPELRDEIMACILQPGTVACFAIPRSSWFCGRFIKHSGWAPDYVDRLFKNGSARFSDDLVHERLMHEGVSQRLKHSLLHYSYRDFSDVLKKVDLYSSASAAQAFPRAKRVTVFTALGHGLWAFLRTYIFRAGFMDGSHGLALAVSSAEGSYYRYLKLWLMQEKIK